MGAELLGLFGRVKGELDGVAHGCATFRPEAQERVFGQLAVVGRRQGNCRILGERDNADPEPLGNVAEERCRRFLGSDQPGGFDIFGIHRPRDIHHEDDGGLFARDLRGALGTGDGGEQQCQRHQ